jgi:hypothetical protein
MGCWGITAFESDAGLDAISLIRKHLPEQGDVELRQMLAWLKADSWKCQKGCLIQAQWQWQN